MTGVVNVSLENGVAVIEIDNPPVNALAQPLRAALQAAVVSADQDPSVRAIVLIGAGRNFVAGAEISELDNPPLEPVLADLLGRIERCSKPVIAAISGFALGGGLELALASHLRLAASDAQLGLPEIKLGLMPGAGGTQRLPRLIGSEAALGLMLSGESISAEMAAEIGLVDRMVPVERLREAALQYAREIASSGAAIRRLCEAAPPAPASEQFLAQQLKRGEKLTRGLVSPARILESVAAASTHPFAEGLALSRQHFEECRVSDSSRALRHLFFAERAAGRIGASARQIERVAVIGAGTMGTGIAIALADAGIGTYVIDPDANSLARSRERFIAHYAEQARRGRCTEEIAAERIARTVFESDLAAASFSDLVIEAVFENLAIKKQVFADLDRLLPSHALLASNTSYLDIDEIAAATGRPGSVLGLHFFSPANVMKLVEVVRGRDTEADALASGAALARRLRKMPVIVGNATGFVGNRMLQAYGRESQLLLLEGATPGQVDAALESWGMAMGPCAVFDLAGLDVGYRARRERSDVPADPRYFRIADVLVDAGRLGRKSGAGHYLYPDGATRQSDPDVQRVIEAAARELGIARRQIADEEIIERCIFALIFEGQALVASGVAASATDIDVVWVNGYGFPRYRGGPMFHAGLLGPTAVQSTLNRLARDHGAAFWTPSNQT